MAATRLRGPCPGCGSDLRIRKLDCEACGLQLRGRFQQCDFCRLTAEEVEFVRIFLSCRGVLRDVERELGISYPTVRGMLDGVLKRMGLVPAPAGAGGGEAVAAAGDSGGAERRKEALDRLERKEIGVEEALRILRGVEG